MNFAPCIESVKGGGERSSALGYSVTSHTFLRLPLDEASILERATPVDAFSNISTLSDLEAQEIVRRYLAEDAAVDLLDPDVVAHLPGDPRRLRFAGSWLGKADVIRMRTHWQNSFEGSIEPIRMVAEQGLVFAQIRLHGIFVPSRASIGEDATILFKTSSERLIERMIWYLNTYPFVALATG